MPAFRRVFPATAGTLAATLLAAALLAASAGAMAGASETKPLIVLAETGSGAQSDAAGLLALAEARGRLPVIVGFAPRQTGHPLAGTAQARRAIAAGQEELLAQLPEAPDAVRFRTVPYVALRATPDELRRLLALPWVTSIHEDVPAYPGLADSTVLVGAPSVWARRLTGRNQVIAVLDTGTDLGHRAFRDRILSEACYSTNEAGGTKTSLCPGGVEQSTRPGATRHCPLDISGCMHGSSVAGIAMGRHAPQQGVAPGADLVSIQVFSRESDPANCPAHFPAPCTKTTMRDVMLGLERVLTLAERRRSPLNIVAVNLSLGGGQYTGACDTDPRAALIDQLRARGIVTTVASMNQGAVRAIAAPACASSAWAVGNTTKTDVVHDTSNHGRGIALLAPGTDILSPAPVDRYFSAIGTSMAAPHVAGAVALLRQARRQGQLPARVRDLERALACTGTIVTRDALPRPRIDVDRALQFLRNPPPDTRSWDFATAAHVQEWHRPSGLWLHRNTGMRAVSLGTWRYFLALAPYCSPDVFVTARIRHVALATQWFDSWRGGLVVSAHVGTQRQASMLGFFVRQRGDGTLRAEIAYFEGMHMTTGQAWERVMCVRPLTGRINAWNDLAVDSYNGRFRFWVNGRLACEATDRMIAGAGQVGVVLMRRAGQSDGDYMDVRRFSVLHRPMPDNAVLFPPQGVEAAAAGRRAGWPAAAGR